MNKSNIEPIRIKSLQVLVAMTRNRFNVKSTARQLNVNPDTITAIITRLINSSPVELFTYNNLTLITRRSKVVGLTCAGSRVVRASEELIKSLELLEVA